MKQNITLKKIAHALNLSVSTVSRALKNNKAISKTTRQKVFELANAMEYEPNSFAVQLRTNSSKVLGLITPTVSSYFYDSFIAAVEKECRANGFSLLILQSEDDAALAYSLSACRKNRVSGIFLCADFLKTLEEFFKLRSQSIPVIFFDKVPDTNAFHKVCLADEQAAALAANYILEKKKKNILALFGNGSLSITVKRLASFQQTISLADNNIKLHTETDIDFKKAIQRTAHHLSTNESLDCIFCMSDEILTGVMRAV